MTIRSIIVGTSGGSATEGAVELGCRIARRFEAHIEGFHGKADPRDLLIYVGDGFSAPLSGDWMDELRAQSAEMAAKSKTAFMAAIARNDLPIIEPPSRVAPSAIWREETGYAPSLVAERARFFDLAVLGRSERVVDQPHSDTVEETLTRSGRPVLLAPAQAPATFGERIALGWDGSPAAVRVLAAALPLLAAARAAFVITVGDKHRESAGAVLDYLGWQGVSAAHRKADKDRGVGYGEQLLASARDEGADLLVMGGYGHTPWREMLFGGATREVVGTSRLPVLLSH